MTQPTPARAGQKPADPIENELFAGGRTTHPLLLISPVRNEARHIERCVRAVANQTRPPTAWVIVDDDSEDETLELLTALEPEIPFMSVVSAPGETSGVQVKDRLANAAAPRAFNYGLHTVRWTDFAYIGKLDGDIELSVDYFEKLLSRFAQDPTLGIASGGLVELSQGGWSRLPMPPHHVPGATKLYTAQCFQAIGGIRQSLGWDTIDETYARMYGFRTRSFDDVVARHHRHWGSADGRMRGRARHGECAYIARFSPLWVAMRSFKIAMVKPYGLSGAAFFYGYVRAAVRGTPKVEDEEFRRFVRRELRSRVLIFLRGRPAP